eukprot:1148468-Pelagomonas_calceolata.AAC.5
MERATLKGVVELRLTNTGRGEEKREIQRDVDEQVLMGSSIRVALMRRCAAASIDEENLRKAIEMSLRGKTLSKGKLREFGNA